MVFLNVSSCFVRCYFTFDKSRGFNIGKKYFEFKFVVIMYASNKQI